MTSQPTKKPAQDRRDPRVTVNHTELLVGSRRDPRVTANHTELLLLG